MSRFVLLILVIICSPWLRAQGNLSFDDQFENGRLDTAYLNNNHYQLWPITNLHCRLTGTQGIKPLFGIYDSLGYQLRSYHKMVYRYEGQSNWNFFDTAYKSGTTANYYFQNSQAFSQDTVYIAYWFPYTYSDLQSYIAQISNDSNVVAFSAGTSIEGRNLFGFEISDTSFLDCYKKEVVITARQHPIENINGYFVEGMANYLLGTDSLAVKLREHFRFIFYPMCNPDGVYNGSGQNAWGQGLNREWADSLQSGGTPEVDSIKRDIWYRTDSAFDFGIDIHANPGSNIPYYWWGFTSGSGVDSTMLQKANSYVAAVASIDSSSNQQGSLFQNYIQGNGVNSAMTAANWFYKSANAVAFTFEPTSEPLGFSGDNSLGVSNLRSAGASLAKGFSDLGDTIDPLKVRVSLRNGSARAIVSGGAPPYSFLWENLSFNDTSTLDFYDLWGGGLVKLSIRDSLGCSFQRVLRIPYSSLPQNPIYLEVFPNPSSSGGFSIKSSQMLEDVKISISSLDGKTLKQEAYKYLKEKQLDFKATGVFILQIRSQGFYDYRLLVVQ